MTMSKRYQHLADELKREAADQLGAALFGDSSVIDLKAWLKQKQAKSS